MKFFINLILLTVLFNLTTSAAVYNIVVAKDGSGKYTSIGTALDRMSADPSRRVIFIKNGVYYEKNDIIGTYKNVCLIGESRDGVIIKFDDYAGKSASSSSTAESYTFKVEGDGFYAENITFQNTATKAQAVAIYTKADTIAFKNCNFLGYQDTHYADNGRQYFLDCTIQGDVDFIFGNAAAVFDHCTIVSSKRKGGYITAPSEAIYHSSTTMHGFLFRNCDIVPEEGLANNSCYLGRPWGPRSSSVFFNCNIGSHIKAVGWSEWDNNNHESTVFAEYKSMDASGKPLDISSRVSWSKQLTDGDTSEYAVKSFFNGWTPYHKTKTPAQPGDISWSANTIQWSAVENARGYAILRNDSVIDFTEEPSYQINSNYSFSNYAIKTVGKYGALSEKASIATDIKITTSQNEFKIIQQENNLIVPENKYTRVISITGKQALLSIEKKSIDISYLQEGIYIIELCNQAGDHLVRKIIINRSY